MDGILVYEMELLHSTILEGGIRMCLDDVEKQIDSLNEGTYAIEITRHIMKVSKETILELLERFQEFINNLIAKVKKLFMAAQSKKIFENETLLRSVNLNDFKTASYSELNKVLNINPREGFSRLENLVDTTTDVYKKEVSKLQGSAEFIIKTKTNPLNMLSIPGVRQALVKSAFNLKVEENELESVSDVSHIISQNLLGDKVELTGRDIKVDVLLRNIKEIDNQIKTVNDMIPRVKQLRNQFDNNVADVSSHRSIVSVNIYVNASLSEYLSIMRITLTNLFNRYFQSVQLLSSILDYHNKHSNNSQNKK